MPHDKLAKFVNVDYENEMLIVAVLKQAGEEKIIGMAGYALDKATGLAEFAFSIADEWQNKGIGTVLFSYLIKIAKMKDIRGFVGYVLDTNVGAYRLTHKMGYPVKSKWEDGVYTLTINFTE
jgi:GNAT superfamily N-acetyltransferase